MKVFELEIDGTDEDFEKVDQAVYAVVEMITALEEDGKLFKITIEEIDFETVVSPNKYLH